MNDDLPILIIGGGLGGMALAVGLTGRGFRVRVFEQAPELKEAGAGITVSGGALRSLDWLGVGDIVRAKSERAAKLPLLHYISGDLISGAYDVKAFPEENEPPDTRDWTTRHMHRADLHDILREKLSSVQPDSVATGHVFVGAEADDDGVTAHFANGVSAHGRALIGCDGLRSSLRAQMFPGETAEFTGQVTWRAMIPIEIAAPCMTAGRSAIFMGPGRVFNRYTVRNRSVVNCVATSLTDVWRGEGWSTPSTVDEFMAQHQGWHPDVTGLIARAPPDQLFKWALFERQPLAAWVQGRMTLLGDAAHPMLPFLGLGAAMAMEDSVVLTRAIEAFGVTEAAFKRYEAARIGRTTLLFHEARRQGRLYQGDDPFAYASGKPPALDRSFYEYDAGATAI
jgi:salicylate hydroxylase